MPNPVGHRGLSLIFEIHQIYCRTIMSNLFIVYKSVDFEGDHILGLYTSKELALQHLSKLKEYDYFDEADYFDNYTAIAIAPINTPMNGLDNYRVDIHDFVNPNPTQPDPSAGGGLDIPPSQSPNSQSPYQENVNKIASLITDDPDILAEEPQKHMSARKEGDKTIINLEYITPAELRKLAAALEEQGVTEIQGAFTYANMRKPV